MSPLRDALNTFVHDWFTFPGNPDAVMAEMIEALEAKVKELREQRDMEVLDRADRKLFPENYT